MYAGAGGRDLFGSRWQELHLLDKALSQLTRPSLMGDSVSSSLRDQLQELGIAIGRTPRREELIARIWGRKRPLMRQLYELDDPTPPCA